MRSWFIRLLGGFTAEQVAAAYTQGVLDNELRHQRRHSLDDVLAEFGFTRAEILEERLH